MNVRSTAPLGLSWLICLTASAAPVPAEAPPQTRLEHAAREKSDIASQYTMADALFSASFLNACLRHAQDVGMANIAPG